jgi:hypothetical protein
MRRTFSALFLSMLISASLLPISPAQAGQIVHCTSRHYHYQYCRADTDNEVSLHRQISSTRCRQGDS